MILIATNPLRLNRYIIGGKKSKGPLAEGILSYFQLGEYTCMLDVQSISKPLKLCNYEYWVPKTQKPFCDCPYLTLCWAYHIPLTVDYLVSMLHIIRELSKSFWGQRQKIIPIVMVIQDCIQIPGIQSSEKKAPSGTSQGGPAAARLS